MQFINAAGNLSAVSSASPLPVAAAGNAAHAATAPTSPLCVGAEARATDRAVSSGQLTRLTTDLAGKLVTTPFSVPELSWSYAAAAGGILNIATGVTIKAAAGVGVRNYLTGIDLMAEPLGVATELAIRDGAGGAVLWRIKVPTTGMALVSVNFPKPLRGTANALLEVVTLTASQTGAVYVNAHGYTAA